MHAVRSGEWPNLLRLYFAREDIATMAINTLVVAAHVADLISNVWQEEIITQMLQAGEF